MFSVTEQEERAVSAGVWWGEAVIILWGLLASGKVSCICLSGDRQTCCHMRRGSWEIVVVAVNRTAVHPWYKGTESIIFGHRCSSEFQAAVAVSRLFITANSTRAHFSQPLPLFLLRLFRCLLETVQWPHNFLLNKTYSPVSTLLGFFSSHWLQS